MNLAIIQNWNESYGYCNNEININNEVARRLKFGIFITKLLDDIGDN